VVPLGVVGKDHEHVFLNTAVVGAYPSVIGLRERMRRFVGLWPAATAAGLWVWFRWPLYDLTIRAADRELRRRTAMLWIGTGPGSFPAPHEAPLSEATDGLELVTLPSTRRRHATRLFRALWARRHGRGPETVGLEVLRAPGVEIHSRHRIRLTLDAEPLVLQSPVRVVLEPEALRVVCAAGPA
jgi:diacylglycerol kinase family enzyme